MLASASRNYRKTPEQSMNRPKPRKLTTLADEGIELHDDAWERFEKTAHDVATYRPKRRTAPAKPTGANRKRGVRAPAKSRR
jgi:hypothetical protein